MKARIKNFEDMPESTKCCPTAVALMPAWCGRLVEVFPTEQQPDYPCTYCGSMHVGCNMALVGFAGAGFHTSLLDLDEGEEATWN